MCPHNNGGNENLFPRLEWSDLSPYLSTLVGYMVEIHTYLFHQCFRLQGIGQAPIFFL
jgi:hypothetical protein